MLGFMITCLFTAHYAIWCLKQGILIVRTLDLLKVVHYKIQQNSSHIIVQNVIKCYAPKLLPIMFTGKNNNDSAYTHCDYVNTSSICLQIKLKTISEGQDRNK